MQYFTNSDSLNCLVSKNEAAHVLQRALSAELRELNSATTDHSTMTTQELAELEVPKVISIDTLRQLLTEVGVSEVVIEQTLNEFKSRLNLEHQMHERRLQLGIPANASQQQVSDELKLMSITDFYIKNIPQILNAIINQGAEIVVGDLESNGGELHIERENSMWNRRFSLNQKPYEDIMGQRPPNFNEAVNAILRYQRPKPIPIIVGYALTSPSLIRLEKTLLQEGLGLIMSSWREGSLSKNFFVGIYYKPETVFL